MSRRGLGITLITLGAVCTALLTIVLRVTITDQWLAWIRGQPWYSDQKAWMIVVLVLVAIAVIAIWQYLLANRPKRTAMILETGIVDPDQFLNAPTGAAGADETAALYVLDVPTTAVSMVQFLLRLTNASDQGLADVRVQLEYPERYLVDEGVVVMFEKTAVVIQEPIDKRVQNVKREVVVLEGVVQASYHVEALRFKETLIIPEPLKIRQVPHEELQYLPDFHPSALTQRLARNPTFFDYLRLKAFVFSQETRLDTKFDIFSFKGANNCDLDVAINAIKDAIWNGEYPQPGHYFTRRRKIRRTRLELSMPQLKPEIPGQLYQEVPLEQNILGITPVFLPRGNFRHTDARPYFGFRVGPRPENVPNDITFLKPKPPSD